jgi:hypothetical protein
MGAVPNSKMTLAAHKEFIRVTFEDGRHQDIAVHGDTYRHAFESIILSCDRVSVLVGDPVQQAKYLWHYNRLTDVVAFSLDGNGNLIGRIEQLVQTLNEQELMFYVCRLAEECDRLEFLLTSEDMN